MVSTIWASSASPVPLIPPAPSELPSATQPPAPPLAEGLYCATKMSLEEPLETVQATTGWPPVPSAMLGRSDAPAVATMAPPSVRLPSDCHPLAVSSSTSIW